jgi:hypothetical protein
MKPTADRVEDFGRLRLQIAFSLVVIVPLGFATKFYAGLGAEWTQGASGGVLYELFWCLVFQFLLPRAHPSVISLAVLTGTCALEFLQLWHPPFLEALRGNFLGRTLLGDTFAWSDFPHYFAGSALGWWWLRRLAIRPAASN